MSSELTFPDPTCGYGYTTKDLIKLLGRKRARFEAAMIGYIHGHCARGVCGKKGGPHGSAYSPSHVKRFVMGLPIEGEQPGKGGSK